MFSSKTHYEPFNNQQYYIDKTEFLEKGMATFPSLYIEGAAASGKTTAVRMFLSRYGIFCFMDGRRTEESGGFL